MNILVIGSGGREHALAWKISASPKVKKIYCAPGNAGISQVAELVSISVDDIDSLLNFAKSKRIDLTVVGPESPLSKGIVDQFEEAGLKIFGPSKKAAALEASKSFSKKIMEKYNIPTAKSKVFTNFDFAKTYLKSVEYPVVVKADGLAAGKGVVICLKQSEAVLALENMMNKCIFGDAGKKVVIEEFLTGEEASFIAFSDGETVLPLPSSQDHKAVFDNDCGPNTGGMGAYSPAPVVDTLLEKKIMAQVMTPLVKAMKEEGCSYKGFLYAGLMINRDQIKVLEFNVRLGDPEAQPLLVRLKSDIVPVMEAVVSGRLKDISLEIDEKPSVCIVMASGGYPGSYKKDMVINGLDKAEETKKAIVFHAGTKEVDNQITAVGGRVLGVTALGENIQDAISNAYSAVSKINWDFVYYRKDIGQKAVKHLSGSPVIGIVMGSDSDLGIMEETAALFKKFGILYEMIVASAHRSPQRAAEYASSAEKRGIKVIIAGAGMAAHLAGVLAAHTILPVIGVPVDASALNGMDSLLATVQMPPGIPVATVAIGIPGAKNAAVLAIQILSLSDTRLKRELYEFKEEMAINVEKRSKKLCNYR